jgi:hypothetical protein
MYRATRQRQSAVCATQQKVVKAKETKYSRWVEPMLMNSTSIAFPIEDSSADSSTASYCLESKDKVAIKAASDE